MTNRLRFEAPRLLCSEGGIDLPGPVAWITAFTTTVSAGPSAQLALSYVHRCHFAATTDHRGKVGLVAWRLESQLLGFTLSGSARIVEGEAANLNIAYEAAIAAALRLQSQLERVEKAILGPAFAAFPLLPGQPRIWGCAAEVAPVDARHGQDVSIRLCLVREKIGPKPHFLCALEEENNRVSSTLSHWVCDTLPSAAETGFSALLSTFMPRRERSDP